jgi:hypothetical protein
MPKVDFSERNFFMGPETQRIYYRVNGINLHNGVVGYNSDNRDLIVSDEDDKLSHQENVKKRPEAVDVLSAPKLNGCHFILIKSKQNPHLFAMAHIEPKDDERQMYQELLQKFPPGDELDVVFCGGFSGNTEHLAQISQEKGYNLSSIRTIPFNFGVETFVTFGEPKSVHFHFIPSDDELIIYSETYSPTGKPAIHISTNVFGNAPSPIEFHKLEIFADKSLTQRALSSPNEFVTILPALTGKFLSDHPKSRLYSYETCPDQIAERIEEKKLAAIDMGLDFEAKARSQDFKIENEIKADDADDNDFSHRK